MYTRYAIYFTPSGALAQAGADWLGWDVATGEPVDHPVVEGLDLAGLTQTPRKYGFHGTLKPPMVLAEGSSAEELEDHLRGFCTRHATVTLEGLAISQMGRFFALTPVGEVGALRGLAGDIVTGFDVFRASPSDAELARRRAGNLSAAQEAYLVQWGYPYVLDQFRFHMTLTGRVKDPAGIAEALETHFAPVLPVPFVLDHLTLAGQRADGMFQEITRVALSC